MLSHIENRKGTKDGRGYPALSTRDFVVNNASSWRRTRRSESWQSVRSGWPLAISLSLFLSLPASQHCLSCARTLFPSPYPVLSFPISLRNLSRINWFDPDVSSRGTPIGHHSHAAHLVRSSLPSPLPPAPHRTKITLFLVPSRSQIFANVTWPNSPRQVNPCWEDRRETGEEANPWSFNESLARFAILRDSLPR